MVDVSGLVMNSAPSWVESPLVATMVGALVGGGIASLLRWADVPRPNWVFDSGGGGGGPDGSGQAIVNLLNAGPGAAVDLHVTGINCDATLIERGNPDHGRGQRQALAAPGSQISIGARWQATQRELVAVEVSWAQASVRRTFRRTRMWIQVGVPAWVERPSREDLPMKRCRRRRRRARFRMGDLH